MRAVRLGALGLLPDGQPLPPADRNAARVVVARDARSERGSYPALQSPAPPGGACAARPLQGGAGRQGQLSAGSLALYRAQSGARASVRASGGLALEQLSGDVGAGRAVAAAGDR